MGRPKEEIEFINVKGMLDYAAHIYPQVQKCMWEDENYIETTSRYIKRTLLKHKLVLEATSNDAYIVSKPVAEFFINTILFDYFSQNDTKIKMEVKKELENKNNAELEKRSEKMNQKINEEQMQLSIEDAERKCYEFAGKDPNESVDSNEDDYFKSDFRYHIPAKEFNKDNADTYNFIEFTDKVIDRMMIRAIFDLFYEFNETEFRRHLKERAGLIFSEQHDPVCGAYAELTRMLENPIGNYVFPKKQKKEKAITKKEMADIYAMATDKILDILAKHKSFAVTDEK